MRVLVVHNRYSSASPSGENRVVDDDVRRLRDDGVEVETYERDSDEIAEFSIARKIELPLRPTYSYEDAKRFRAVLKRFGPDVVHVHNVFPLISPAIIPLAKRAGAAVVQTVHNYRHVCPAGTLFRDGRPCEKCVATRTAWPAVVHGCYRDSRAASVSMSFSTLVNRRLWLEVDRFLAVGPTVADRLRALGIDHRRITVRPNVIADDGEPPPLGRDALYVGRLTKEKGVDLLLSAWSNTRVRSARRLHIAGAGPLSEAVETAASGDLSIVYHGLLPEHLMSSLLDEAAIAIVPSIWEEPDNLAAARALGRGRPVLATNRGALPSYIGSDNGWIVEANEGALCSAIDTVFESEEALQHRGAAARRLFLEARLPTMRPLTVEYRMALGREP